MYGRRWGWVEADISHCFYEHWGRFSLLKVLFLVCFSRCHIHRHAEANIHKSRRDSGLQMLQDYCIFSFSFIVRLRLINFSFLGFNFSHICVDLPLTVALFCQPEIIYRTMKKWTNLINLISAIKNKSSFKNNTQRNLLACRWQTEGGSWTLC